jgi:hypothetical protein
MNYYRSGFVIRIHVMGVMSCHTPIYKDIVQPKKRRVKSGINGFASTWYTIAAVLYVNFKNRLHHLGPEKGGVFFMWSALQKTQRAL